MASLTKTEYSSDSPNKFSRPHAWCEAVRGSHLLVYKGEGTQYGGDRCSRPEACQIATSELHIEGVFTPLVHNIKY